jgi:hypothetical protein
MDIRDYLPPSLKHVMVYASPAEREKRMKAARDAFGRPTPVPRGSTPGDEEATLKKAPPASPWSTRESSSVDKEALPSALMPPADDIGPVERAKETRPAKAQVRVVPLRVVMVAALLGLVAGGVVIARAKLGGETAPVAASAMGGATATAPKTAAPPSAMGTASMSPLGVVPAATAAESATATAAPSTTVSARAPAGPSTAKSTKPPYVEERPEF